MSNADRKAAVREVVNAAIELVHVDDGPAWVRLDKAVKALLRLGWGEQLKIGGQR